MVSLSPSVHPHMQNLRETRVTQPCLRGKEELCLIRFPGIVSKNLGKERLQLVQDLMWADGREKSNLSSESTLKYLKDLRLFGWQSLFPHLFILNL